MAQGDNMGTIGGVLGGVAGFALTGGNPLGAQIGAGLGSSVGGMIGGAQQKRAAEKMNVAPVDPMQSTMLEQVRRRRRALETGSAFSNANEGIKSTLATTQRNILRRSGGQVGSAIAGLGLAQGQAARQMGALQAQQLQLANQVAAQEQALADKMAQRRLELGLLQQNRLMAQGMESAGKGAENLATLGAYAMGLKAQQEGGALNNPFANLFKPKETQGLGIPESTIEFNPIDINKRRTAIDYDSDQTMIG